MRLLANQPVWFNNSGSSHVSSNSLLHQGWRVLLPEGRPQQLSTHVTHHPRRELTAFQAEIPGPVCTYYGSKPTAWHPPYSSHLCLPTCRAPATGCQHNGASTHPTPKENLGYR
ncbi:hypothetical protein BgiMline_030423 [Biomphalaria glabrata]|nr:hypothetical protein BgiMline_027743 [Biomphalaria glabrata]